MLLVGRAPQFFFAQLPLHTSWTSAPVTLPQVPGVVDNPGLVSWGAPLVTATGRSMQHETGQWSLFRTSYESRVERWDNRILLYLKSGQSCDSFIK